MVVGNNFSPDMPDKCLTIIDNFKNVPGTYNIQAIGSNAIALSPADHNSTVYIGDAIIYSDTDNVYLSTFDKGLSLDWRRSIFLLATAQALGVSGTDPRDTWLHTQISVLEIRLAVKPCLHQEPHVKLAIDAPERGRRLDCH